MPTPRWEQRVYGAIPTVRRMTRAFSGVGAGTKDTGFSLTRLTFQITHATDSDTNAERDYLIAELMKNRVIMDARPVQARQHLPAERVNHYVTDGEVTVASLTATAPGFPLPDPYVNPPADSRD